MQDAVKMRFHVSANACSNKKEELVILEMRRMEILNDIHKIQYNIRLLDEMAVIVKGDST